MSTDRSPSGTHPGDATLLFLGDVVNEADAGALIDELARDPDTASDPAYGPAAITAAWAHVTGCNSCSARRIALLTRVDVLLTEGSSREPGTDSASSTSSAGAADTRVTTAVRELVPSPGAVPAVLSSTRTGGRSGFLGGFRRGEPTSGVSGSGGVLAGRRPWVVGAVLGLGLLAATIALRPGTSQTGAIARPSTNPPTSASAETAAADTAAAVEQERRAPEKASADTIAGAPGGAAKSDAESFTVDSTAPLNSGDALAAAAPPPATTTPAATGIEGPTAAAIVAPVTTPPSTASLSRSKKIVAPNEPIPTLAPVAPPAPVAAGIADAATKPPAGTDVDLGAFTAATDILDRFTAVVGPAAPSTPSTPSAPLSSATAAAPAAAPPTDRQVCPQPLPGPRANATLGGLSVVVLRLVDPTGRHDVVLDARTCVELARRPSPPAPTP